MTAPDPGLTDLIAAHRWTCSRDEDCICGWVGQFADFPAHVALVVEQHTNGRKAETVKSTGQRMYAQTKKWQERAEKAEATIARVEKLAHDMRGWCSPHGISVTYSDRIHAALEGEQQ